MVICLEQKLKFRVFIYSKCYIFKVNNKHVIIFSRAPKLIATPSLRIGEPLEYEKREERGDFEEESKIIEIEKIDISVP